ncbi:MAG: hypothetical protein ACFFAJ_07350 [Candidatus Hodarchaeota archaeon]
MGLKNEEETGTKVSLFGLIALAVLLVFAGIVRPLIVPEDTEVELDTILYSMFTSASFALVAIAFYIQGLAEDNNFLRIFNYISGFILATSTIFGIDFVAISILTLITSVLYIEIFLLLAFAFALTSGGIYVLRRS